MFLRSYIKFTIVILFVIFVSLFLLFYTYYFEDENIRKLCCMVTFVGGLLRFPDIETFTLSKSFIVVP